MQGSGPGGAGAAPKSQSFEDIILALKNEIGHKKLAMQAKKHTSYVIRPLLADPHRDRWS